MRAELDPASEAVHLDGEAVDTLLATGRLDTVPAEALEAIRTPLATVTLTVAGGSTLLRHRIWATPASCALLLGVSDDAFRLMTTPPAFLTAGLVRLTRMRVRVVAQRTSRAFAADRLTALVDEDPGLRSAALTDAGADFAWRLAAKWHGGERVVTAVDGPRGLHLADPDAQLLRPVSNTLGYRVLSTVLPTDDELARQA